VPDTPTADSRLADAAHAEIIELARQVEDEDGAPPLSDQARTRIGAGDGYDLVLRRSAKLIGYGRLDDSVAEIVARPEAVRPLLDAAQLYAQGPLTVWSHGKRSRLIPTLADAGFQRIRELHQLRRPLGADAGLPPDPPLPDGAVVRDFRPGIDDAAWLALNAAAFASHREQGSWTLEDLDARINEPWFDPRGFLLAEQDGRLLGFHWTKIHEDGSGEVYILGVAPQAQGLGLGRALLIRGLRYLASHRCPFVLLYVDGDNTAALHIYERDGFTSYDLDAQWRASDEPA
jgi:mycothiol synthase